MWLSGPLTFASSSGYRAPCTAIFEAAVSSSPEIVGRKFHGSGSEVLLEPMQLGRAWDRNNPRFLRKQPGKRDLRRCRLLLLRKLANQIHHRLIRFPVFRRKRGNDVAEIALVELRIFADLSGKKAFTQRAEGNEPDPEFLQCRV